MKPKIALLLGLLSATAVAAPAFGARVKKASGELLEGEIKGHVVLQRVYKDGEVESPTEAPPSTDGLSSDAAGSASSGRRWTYMVIQGKYVTTMDENGVQAEDGKSLVLMERFPALRPSEPELLLSEMRGWFDLKEFKGNRSLITKLPSGVEVVGAVLNFDPKLFRIIGEFRGDSRGGALIPALEIKTKQGVVTVPVSEIAAPEQLLGAAPQESGPETADQDPMGMVLAAKSVALVAVGPGPMGAGGFMKQVLTGRQNPNAERAKNHLKSELEKMKRFTFTEDPLQADLVLAIEEGEEEVEGPLHLSLIYLYDQLLVFKGGAVPDDKAQSLWRRFYREINSNDRIAARGFPSQRVALQFRKDVENAEKWRKK